MFSGSGKRENPVIYGKTVFAEVFAGLRKAVFFSVKMQVVIFLS